MRSLVSRLKRLERIERRAARPRIVIHFGHLKTLPPDYKGPRHQVTVRQIPPEDLPPQSREQLWYDWEERPGLGKERTWKPSGREDEIVIQVQYVPCANRPMPIGALR